MDNSALDQRIFVIQLAEANRPVYTEKKGALGGYLEYGEGNLYPNYLLGLYEGSAKHGAIIRGKVTYITGKGWIVKSGAESPSANAFIKKVNPDESLQNVAMKMAFDLEIFGACYLHIVWSMFGGKLAAFYHTDFSRIRTNKDNTQFWYKEDWAETRGKKHVIPAFNPAYRVGDQILMIKDYGPGQNAYGKPSYLGALDHIEADIQVGRHVNNNAQSGFTGSKHITLFEGPNDPDLEKRKEIESKLKKKFTGGSGQKIIVSFAPNPELKASIEDLGQSDLSKEDFTAVDDLIQANIYAGHQIPTPALFGVSTPGKLGTTTELKDGYQIFNATYVQARQTKIEEAINTLGQLKGIDAELQIAQVDPLNLFDAAMIAGIMTDEEKREAAGLKPLEKPTMAQGAVIADAIERLPALVANKVLETLTVNEIRSLAGLRDVPDGGAIPTATASVAMSDSLAMWDEFGATRDRFTIVSSRAVNFQSDEDMAADEEGEGVQMIALAAQTITELEGKIITLIRGDKLINAEGIALATNTTQKVVESTIKSLEKRGVIETSTGKTGVEERKIVADTPEAKAAKNEPSTVTNLKILYSYEGPQDSKNRPFCAKLKELDRLYSRKEIETLSSRLGYSVFDRRGGWYHNPATNKNQPFCRHSWASNVVVDNG